MPPVTHTHTLFADQSQSILAHRMELSGQGYVAGRSAIGDGDDDGLQFGSWKNTSQLMLSTRNAISTAWVGEVCDQRPQSGAFQKTYAHCEFYRP